MLLLGNPGVKLYDYEAIYMENGFIKYIFNAGSGNIRVESGKRYNDGKWHEIHTQRDKSEGNFFSHANKHTLEFQEALPMVSWLTGEELLAEYNFRHCVKIVQIQSFFWSVFSRIHSKYGKIRTRKNSISEHFSRSVNYCSYSFLSFYLLIFLFQKVLYHHRYHHREILHVYCIMLIWKPTRGEACKGIGYKWLKDPTVYSLDSILSRIFSIQKQ